MGVAFQVHLENNMLPSLGMRPFSDFTAEVRFLGLSSHCNLFSFNLLLIYLFFYNLAPNPKVLGRIQHIKNIKNNSNKNKSTPAPTHPKIDANNNTKVIFGAWWNKTVFNDLLNGVREKSKNVSKIIVVAVQGERESRVAYILNEFN